jgi:hypothetical protein
MNKRSLLSASAIVILCIAIFSGIYILFFRDPQVEWNRSSSSLVITEERPLAELSYNYIPDFQIWGDGYIVWVTKLSDGKRSILEGYLTEEQMTALLGRFAQANFFKLYRRFFEKDYTLPQIRITLTQESYSKLIDTEDESLYELVSFVKNGAGIAGKEYNPTRGTLIAFPIQETDWPSSDTKADYKWPDEFGYDLSSMTKSKEITGDQLAFAWQVVNNRPIVESKGKVYWIAVVVPKISPFGRDFPSN